MSRRRSRHWRLGPVLDQGATPHCVGYAWAGWLAASPIRQRPILPSGIYSLAQHLDEWEGEDYDGTSVRAAAKVLQITGQITEYRWEWSVAAAINYVLERGPLVVGLNWYAGMEATDDGGFVHPTGKLRGGHAVLMYGARLGNKRHAAIRNSWGSSWGVNGNCRIAVEDLERLLSLSEHGECCAAVEQRAGT